MQPTRTVLNSCCLISLVWWLLLVQLLWQRLLSLVQKVQRAVIPMSFVSTVTSVVSESYCCCYDVSLILHKAGLDDHVIMLSCSQHRRLFHLIQLVSARSLSTDATDHGTHALFRVPCTSRLSISYSVSSLPTRDTDSGTHSSLYRVHCTNRLSDVMAEWIIDWSCCADNVVIAVR